jgi:hypothetical protein
MVNPARWFLDTMRGETAYGRATVRVFQKNRVLRATLREPWRSGHDGNPGPGKE